MRCDILDTSDPRWGEALAGAPHDTYHIPGYGRVAATQEAGQAFALLAEEGDATMLIPLVRRSLPEEADGGEGWWDAVSPYGYANPVFRGARPDQAARLLRAAFERLGAEGCVCLFLRLHPLLQSPLEPLRALGVVVEHGPTVHFDLAHSDEEAHARMHPSMRRGIRRLERAGYTTVLDDWRRLDDFVAIYEATMRRVGARAYYRLGAPYFQGLREQLPAETHLCAAVAPDGETAAAGLFFERDGIVQYHLGGTADHHLPNSPFKLVAEAGRSWSRERGNRYFHLGGGLGTRDDPLLTFKLRLSPDRSTFRTARIVVDKDRYALVHRRLSMECRYPEEVPDAYFPGYRA